ncbi:sialidase-2-like [Antedon mediterranea]|uniref:sialidase-2-like n=1 Tax=Antedon mediterranea TaxID=105859 RepID=UPI003AF5D54E
MGGFIPLPESTNCCKKGNKISGGECQPADMGSDNVVINCRTGDRNPRFQCYSYDACKTFSDSEMMPTLIEPKNGCQGSIIGFKANDSERLALFSNPATSCVCRKNLSVRLSKDQSCKTYDPPNIVIEPDDSAYSDLAAFIQDGGQTFACLFERNKKTRNIAFTTFTLDALLH